MAKKEKIFTGIQRSRRNLIKVGAIAGTAALTACRLTDTGNDQGTNLTASNGWGGIDQGGNDQGGKGWGGNGRGGNGQGANGWGGNGWGGNGSGNCFLKGTKIRTAKGDRKVEDLSRGDLVPTVFGGIRPIKWIGHYSLKKRYRTRAWSKKALPVRIARSALALDVPCADLFVTQEHAVLIDGVLVTAGSLINGTTITVYDPGELDELEFFHMELERHNAIYAEGAPCETLRGVEELAVDFAGHSMTQEAPCAPLLSCTGARREIKSRFRSALSPWIDRRHRLDIIRDELEERGIAVLRDRNAARDDCGVLPGTDLARFIS